jgi:hypothetical protein
MSTDDSADADGVGVVLIAVDSAVAAFVGGLLCVLKKS